MREELDLFNFGVVVCDECHYLKNQRAARTKVNGQLDCWVHAHLVRAVYRAIVALWESKLKPRRKRRVLVAVGVEMLTRADISKVQEMAACSE